MRTRLPKTSRRENGSVLAITLVFGAVVGVILLSYLELLESRTKIRARSLAWNQAIPVLEQGIEEAFSHLHEDLVLSSNKWTVIGTNLTMVYRRGRTNSDSSYFIVTISNATSYPYNAPVIYSQGFVPAPYQQGFISRLVRVQVTNWVTFNKAIQSKAMIDLNGQSIVDSFDSSNTNYSTGGRYDPAKRRSNGNVATDSRNTPAVDAGNGHIYGVADTGPGGTCSTTAGGTIGDLNWTSGIEPGYTNDDMNVSYPDVQPPDTTGWAALSSVSTNYSGPLTNFPSVQYMLGNQNYIYPGDFSINSGNVMVINGTASLYVSGKFSMNGGTTIYIAPGAKLNLWVNGSTTTFTGGGVINDSGLAANLSYYGTTNNTTIKYSGGSTFVATLYAPEADFTLSGGASFIGAVIINSYTSKSSGAAMHYDESLAGPGQLKLLAYREL
jgi:hypothetical protein